MRPVLRILAFLTEAFPLWVLICSALALVRPKLFTWFSGSLITVGLGIIMLSMGMTLGFDDFRRIGRERSRVLPGVLLQYSVMPALGWSLGYLLALPTPFAVGLVLVSCCPGGTASNVISYLAKADVALSVTMTVLSTLLAALMTPTLTALLAGDVPLIIAPPTAVLPNIKAGKLRALAATGPQRWPGLPDVPTVAEQGVAGYDVRSWAGVMAPVGLPKAVLERLNAEINRALQLPNVRARLEEMGGEARGSTPEDMKNMVASETQRWSQVIAEAKIPKQ